MAAKPTYEELEKKVRELQEDLDRFRLLSDRPLGGYQSLDENGNFIDVDADWLDIFGYPPEEVVGKSFIGFLHPDSKDHFRENFSRLKAAGEVSGVEFEMVKKDGSSIPVSFSGKIARNKRGGFQKTNCILHDISKGKQMEEALKESEERYKELFERSLDGIYIHDFEGNFIEANPAALDMLGYTKEETKSLNFASLLSEDKSLKKGFAALRDIVEKGAQEDLSEYELKKKNGDYVYVESKGSLIHKEGKPHAIVGIARDITRRKWTEELLRKHEAKLAESNQLLSGILDHTYMMAVFLDPEFNFIWVNRAYADSCRQEPPFFPGKNHFDLYPDEENQAIFQRVVDTGEPFFVEAKPFEFPDQPDRGLTYWDWSLIPLKDDSGKVTGLVFTLIEITGRVKAEEALRESEEKYRLIMASMKDAACITSKAFRIEYMNPKMIDSIGRDAVGEICYKALYGRDTRCSWCVFDRVQGGECVEYELINPMDKRSYMVANSPVYHAGGNISKLSIFHDITEKKATESQLRQARKMESIGTLAGGLAHDFNNILFTIVGNTELALDEIPDWNPVHSNLEEIKASSIRAAGIIKQLLNFSRNSEHELKPTNVVAVIGDMIKFLRSTGSATIEIRKHITEKDIVILADSILINQALMNLCANSFQSMEEQGGILEITVEEADMKESVVKNFPDLVPGKYAKITVSDTGPGIDPEIIDRIFDPYFTTKEVGKGSGMGLSVVLGIVKTHGGAIAVDSQPGKGATFTMFFQVVDEKTVTQIHAPDEIPHGDETILFVDDEKSIAIMARKILERLGYRVEASSNPAEALELFQSKPHEFDLVITDMAMPQMTGIKISEKLKAVRSDIPVIICTGHSPLIDEEKAEKLGIDAYVMKPIAKGEIARTIRNVLDDKKNSVQ